MAEGIPLVPKNHENQISVHYKSKYPAEMTQKVKKWAKNGLWSCDCCQKWKLNLGCLEPTMGEITQYRNSKMLFFNVWAIESQKIPKKIRPLTFDFSWFQL